MSLRAPAPSVPDALPSPPEAPGSTAAPHLGARGWAALLAVCAGALALRWSVALGLPNLHAPDEIHQSLEQAHRLVFGYGIVPWEFREGIRSWLLPGFLAGIMALTRGLGEGSGGYLAAIALVLCILSLAPVISAFLWGWCEHGVLAGLVAGTVVAVWFELVFFAPKALTEVVAAHALAPGLLLAQRASERPDRRTLLWAGGLLGLAVVLRMHLAPAVLVAMAFTCRARFRERWTWMVAGAAVPVLLAGALDWATWGLPFRSFWLNFQANILEGKARTFGVAPAPEYLVSQAHVWGWAALPLLGLAVLGARRAPMLAAVALTVLLSHSAIAHKEYRFIYPMLVALVLLVGLGLAELVGRHAGAAPRQRVLALAGVSLWALLSLWRAADFSLGMLPPVSTDLPPVSLWTLRSEGLGALDELGSRPDVCGVGFVGVGWAWTGGYSHLHRDVPLFEVHTPQELQARTPAMNALLVARPPSRQLGPFEAQACWDDICVFQRSGRCTPVEGYSLNRWIEQQGQ